MIVAIAMIETTAPSQPLELTENFALSGGNRLVQGAGWLTNAPGSISAFSAPASTGFYYVSGWQLEFVSNSADRVRIDSNGNVGIGTTAPGAKLEVVGSIRLVGGGIQTDCDGSVRATTGHCYKYFSTTATWANAEDTCRTWGGHLASVSSYAENRFVYSLVPSGTNPWIGGTDSENEAYWSWTADHPFSYTAWNSGEPNGSTNENCLQIYSTTAGWNDSPCTSMFSDICDKGL